MLPNSLPGKVPHAPEFSESAKDHRLTTSHEGKVLLIGVVDTGQTPYYVRWRVLWADGRSERDVLSPGTRQGNSVSGDAWCQVAEEGGWTPGGVVVWWEIWPWCGVARW